MPAVLCLQQTDKVNSFLWTIHPPSGGGIYPSPGGGIHPPTGGPASPRPSYLFGTIHVPYTRVWDSIPQNCKNAFHQADSVHFELDLLDPYTISALNHCQLLPRGETLADILPRDLYRRLKRHLAHVRTSMGAWVTDEQRGRGLYAEYMFDAITGNWERKRPIYVMLMVNSLTEGDIRARGTPVLDLYLAQEAERLGKRRGAVERVEEHCAPLNQMSLHQVG